jgi:predicted O-methyltransferase YrrM
MRYLVSSARLAMNRLPTQHDETVDIESRLDELRKTPRCGGDLNLPVDTTPGLIDLVREARPGRVLELGGDRGVSTEVFLLLCEEVVVVDPWEDFPDIAFAFDHVKGDAAQADFMNMRHTRGQQFLDRCGEYPNLKIIRDYSPNAQLAMAGKYTGYFDLVYIDAVHESWPVIDDVRASWPLVREGGWIAGHDYGEGARDPVPEGNKVIPAVDFLFGEGNVKVFSDSSWLIRRPDRCPPTPSDTLVASWRERFSQGGYGEIGEQRYLEST